MPEKDVRALTLRLEPKQLERIDRLNQDRHHTTFRALGSTRPPVPARSDFIRWLLEIGMDQVEKSLRKAGAR